MSITARPATEIVGGLVLCYTGQIIDWLEAEQWDAMVRAPGRERFASRRYVESHTT
jgi:hypothetical protein